MENTKELRIQMKQIYWEIYRDMIPDNLRAKVWQSLSDAVDSVDDEGILESAEALGSSFEGGVVAALEWLRKQDSWTKRELRSEFASIVEEVILGNWLRDYFNKQ